MLLLYGMAGLVAVFFWLFLHSDLRSLQKNQAVAAKPGIKDKGLPDSAERDWLYLSGKGIWYRFHRKISPLEYREWKLAFGIGTALVGALIGMRYSVAIQCICIVGFFGAGYLMPDLYFLAENFEDNRKILQDMHILYDTLRVYLAIDVFITDALEECYLQIKNRRLKAAVYELKEGLKAQAEQLNEIESFRCKFDNPHINQLANLLAQYYRTGDVSVMMGDLTEQMAVIDHALNLRIRERMEWKSIIKEVLVLLGMLGGIAVALIGSLGKMLGEFF